LVIVKGAGAASLDRLLSGREHLSPSAAQSARV
jgi:hypothetical protein